MKTKPEPFELSAVAEVSWDFEGGDDDPDWGWMNSNAAFAHRDACEFIIHGGDLVKLNVKSMREYGCSKHLIATYKAAAKKALRVLFYS